MQFPGGRPRSCEDLKARYYSIARALHIAREGTEATIANSTLVKQPFNAQHERHASPSAVSCMLRKEHLMQHRWCAHLWQPPRQDCQNDSTLCMYSVWFALTMFLL